MNKPTDSLRAGDHVSDELGCGHVARLEHRTEACGIAREDKDYVLTLLPGQPLSGHSRLLHRASPLLSDAVTPDARAENMPKRARKATMPANRLFLLAAGVVTALALAGTAAATPIYWAPAKMGKALLALNYQAPPDAHTAAATCKGLAKPRNGLYAGFRCSLRYAFAATGQTAATRTVYARPLRLGRVCASMTSLAACRPVTAGPLAGDPRVCSHGDASACTRIAAEAAAVKQARIDTGNPYAGQQVSCTPASQFVYRCDTSGVIYTVTFTKGPSAWTTTVTR